MLSSRNWRGEGILFGILLLMPATMVFRSIGREHISWHFYKVECDEFQFPDEEPLLKHICGAIDFSVKAEDKLYYAPDSSKYERLNRVITDSNQIYRFADYGIQASKEGISFTLKANMGSYPDRISIVKDNFGIRNITPLECLALHGFPSSFAFPAEVPL